MFVAKQKRRENIAEYILYLWQLEDLLRALKFDPRAIQATLVDRYEGLDAESKSDLQAWYEELGALLKEEGKLESGHLAHTLHLVEDLNDLHGHLLKAPVGRQYAALFGEVEPELRKLKSEFCSSSQNQSELSDIELCFKALYSVMLCRMKGVDAESQYVQDVLEVVSPLIAKLSSIHKQAEEGTIDLYEEDEK